MFKNFNNWNILKQTIEYSPVKNYPYPREIWWCSLGINIGAEIDGKNDNFERPVLVLRAYNKDTLLVLPMTSKSKDDNFHFKVSSKFYNTFVSLTQMRVISNKRFIRKIRILPQIEFNAIKEAAKKFI